MYGCLVCAKVELLLGGIQITLATAYKLLVVVLEHRRCRCCLHLVVLEVSSAHIIRHWAGHQKVTPLRVHFSPHVGFQACCAHLRWVRAVGRGSCHQKFILFHAERTFPFQRSTSTSTSTSTSASTSDDICTDDADNGSASL